MAAGGLTGLLLAAAGPPLELAWVALAALIPWCTVLIRPGAGVGRAVLSSLGAGAALSAVLFALLGFPWLLGLVLGLAVCLAWVAAGLTTRLLLRSLPPWAALGVVPAALALSDWALVTWMPGFGTAQSLARPLARLPVLIQAGAIGGSTLLVFLLALPQVAGALLLRRTAPRLAFGTLAVVAVGVAGGGAWRLGTPEDGRIRVAAAGWTRAQVGSPWDSPLPPTAWLERTLVPLLEGLEPGSVDLLVTPEAAYRYREGEEEPLRAALSALADTYDLYGVFGVFDVEGRANRAWLFDPEGTWQGSYTKTHLIAGIERYRAGDGTLLVHDAPWGRLGVLICQDDNFTGLSRAYARAGVEVLAVPTNDWREVESFHLQNARLRAVDAGMVLVRGATDGISAVVDDRGRIRGRSLHRVAGPALVQAEVPRPGGTTPFTHLAPVFPGVFALLLVGAGAVAMRRQTARGASR